MKTIKYGVIDIYASLRFAFFAGSINEKDKI